MFQFAVARLLIPGLIIFAFLAAIFWFKKKKVTVEDPCCKGKCAGKKGPEGGSEKSEEKKDGTNDA
jgi:hypothetical protein